MLHLHIKPKAGVRLRKKRTLKRFATSNTSLDINNVYVKYIDLYKHLDKLIWTSLAGVLGIVTAALTLFVSVFDKKYFNGYFFAVAFLPLSFLTIIVYRFNETIEKFNRGRDYICKVISVIEDESGLFSKEISIPSEPRSNKSFFLRRVATYEASANQKRMFYGLTKVINVFLIFLCACLVVDLLALIAQAFIFLCLL